MDYNKLGFKCGIEIHQQIEGKKLFSKCPTEIRKDKADYSIKRWLRASAGEDGKIDASALYEMSKQKYFVYEGYDDTTSLVELDEEPPQPINQDALFAALQVCKMLNCKIVDQIQVMRKIVVDGSNVSGFQRTMLIGMNGYVEVNGKKIGIESVCLEEDACQAVKRNKDHDVYNLSRLGIPLLEIATAPDITHPDECKEVAGKIGMILRSTSKMKRGIGSIRQDVNISIKGSSRIEIKGFQDLKSIPKVVNNEILRQQKEIKKGKKVESHVRKAESDFSTSYLRPMPGAARMYPETDIPKINTPSSKDIKIPELLDDKAEGYEKKYKLPQGYGKEIIKLGIDFDSLAKNNDGRILADFLITIPKDLKKRDRNINRVLVEFELEDSKDIKQALIKVKFH